MPLKRPGLGCRSSCYKACKVIEEPANRNQLSEEPRRTLQELEGETFFDGVSLEKIANEVGTPA